MARVPGCEAVYDVANQWRQRCLESDGSLLWPDLDEPTWTLENLQRAQILVKDLGERRIAGGLTTAFASESTAVKRVLADTVAVWNLFPGELLASTRTEFVERFASQAGEGASLNLVRTAIAQDIGRFERRPFRPGLQMNRIYHLAFFLLFSIRYKQTETLSHDQTAMIALLKASSKEVPGSKSGLNMLLHGLFPDVIEPIFNDWAKDQILSTASFMTYAQGISDPDDRLAAIRERLIAEGVPADFNFYDQQILERWLPSYIASSPTQKESRQRRFWKIAPGDTAKLWSRFRDERAVFIAWDLVGDLRQYNANTLDELKSQLKANDGFIAGRYSPQLGAAQLWSFLNEISIGDRVCAYGNGKIWGWGTVAGNYEFDDSWEEYKHKREINWESLAASGIEHVSNDLKLKLQQNKTIVELTESEFNQAIGRATQSATVITSGSSTLEVLKGRTFLSLESLATLEHLLRTKRQLIFEGPPGTGKTYTAKLFARYLAGLPLVGPPDPQVEIVQFHQSYGYEDFVAGIRPSTTPEGTIRYDVQPGIFIEMCKRAESNPDRNFMLIIDEINRGNVSRIFGELLYALEYRDEPVRLQYPDLLGDVDADHLTIPKNLFLIGTMNSTDRSLAMIDYALRRRFFFWKLRPVVDGQAPVLAGWMRSQSFSAEIIDDITNRFVRINEQVSALLNPDYAIGHSYFMDRSIGDHATRERIWTYALQPLLEEYFHSRHDRDEDISTLRRLMLDD